MVLKHVCFALGCPLNIISLSLAAQFVWWTLLACLGRLRHWLLVGSQRRAAFDIIWTLGIFGFLRLIDLIGDLALHPEIKGVVVQTQSKLDARVERFVLDRRPQRTCFFVDRRLVGRLSKRRHFFTSERLYSCLDVEAIVEIFGLAGGMIGTSDKFIGLRIQPTSQGSQVLVSWLWWILFEDVWGCLFLHI